MEEKKLNRMMQSIMDQTFQKLQIILVDDGSTDDTLLQLKKWKEFFATKRLDCMLFSKPNGGSASGINFGLKCFTGKYVCFPDADDALEPDFVSSLVTYLEDNPTCNIVRCDATIITEFDKSVDPYVSSEDFSEHGFFKSILIKRINKVVWPMLVRSDFLRCRIPTLHLYEGGPLGAQEWQILFPLSYKTEVAHLKVPLYNHYLYSDSHVRSNIGYDETSRLVFNGKIKEDLFATLDTMMLPYAEKELYRDMGEFYIIRLNMAFAGLSENRRYGFALLLAYLLNKYMQTVVNINLLMIKEKFLFHSLSLEKHFLEICI